MAEKEKKKGKAEPAEPAPFHVADMVRVTGKDGVEFVLHRDCATQAIPCLVPGRAVSLLAVLLPLTFNTRGNPSGLKNYCCFFSWTSCLRHTGPTSGFISQWNGRFGPHAAAGDFFLLPGKGDAGLSARMVSKTLKRMLMGGKEQPAEGVGVICRKATTAAS